MRHKTKPHNKIDINNVNLQDYSFWYGQPTDVYDGKETFITQQNDGLHKELKEAWTGYDQTMVDHAPVLNDHADYNMILGYRRSDSKLIPVKLATDPCITRKNSNMIIIGGSGTGKTFKYIIPNIAQMNGSYIVVDPYGEIYENMATMLMENGYNVLRFDPANPSYSNIYNPIDYVYDEEGRADDVKVSYLVNAILDSTTPASVKDDPFWEKNAHTLLQAIIMYVADFYPQNQRDLFHAAQLFKHRGGEPSEHNLRQIMDDAQQKHPNAKCFEYYEKFCIIPEKTRNALIDNIGVRMVSFVYNDIPLTISKTPEVGGIDLNTLNTRKTALFIIGQHETIPHPLANIIIAQSMYCLARPASGDWAIISDGILLRCNLSSQEQAKKICNQYRHAHVQPTIIDDTTYYYICDPEGKVIEGTSSKEAGEKLLEQFKHAAIIEDEYVYFHTQFILDEFVNSFQLHHFPEQMAIARQYHLSYAVVIQDVTQLKHLYGPEAYAILGNADVITYLGSSDVENTAGFISDLCGDTLIKADADSQDLYIQPLISKEDVIHLAPTDCIVYVRGLRPMLLEKPSFVRHPRFNESGIGNLSRKLSLTYLTGYYKGLYADRNADNTSALQTGTYRDIPLNNPEANQNMIALLGNYCSDDMCKEPTKHCVGSAIRTSLDGLDYVRYGKYINMYQCDNIACPNHPNHKMTINELAHLLKLQNPDKASKRDILGAVLDIIER